MAWQLTHIMSVPTPMLVNCLDPYKYTSVKIETKYKEVKSDENAIWKILTIFPLVSMCHQ